LLAAVNVVAARRLTMRRAREWAQATRRRGWNDRDDDVSIQNCHPKKYK